MEDSEPRSKIFINPNFKKAHFNPNFLPKATTSAIPTISGPVEPLSAPTTAAAAVGPLPSSIHFNPAFLGKLRIEPAEFQAQNEAAFSQQPATVVYPMSPSNPIIQNTKRKLVRASSARPAVATSSGGSSRAPLLAPLVKISKNKLVRSVPVALVPAKTSPSSKPVRPVGRPYKLPHQTSHQLYKLDRRPGHPGTIRKSVIRRYSLTRTNSISPQKVVVTDRRLLKLRRPKQLVKGSTAKISPNHSFPSPNKKLVMVNINGVLYRSSSNKLQVSSAPRIQPKAQAASRPVPSKQERCLTIRGTRFLLDSSGTKLRKMPSLTSMEAVPMEAKLRRIDIGGLTYLPKTDGTFERTDNHRTRTYLSSAKQKSIHLLTSKMRTCNVPCPIFRRLGKCAAFLKGRCPKVHDPKHVTICPKFLKGECTQDGCLLSHNVSLEKMPVCRFFLEGRCVNDSCPYLHKKVSETAQVCEDFLRGFCPLAAKCQRRHEFICPEFDRLGACARTKCPYPHKAKQRSYQGKRVQSSQAPVTIEIEQPAAAAASSMQRYYYDRSPPASDGQSETLNDDQKVQLKRLLGKVEKMKQGHLEGHASGDSAGVTITGASASEPSGDMKSDEVMEIDDSDDDDHGEADQRPPILRRAKLGPLPSFIPI